MDANIQATSGENEKDPLWTKAYKSLTRYLKARDHSEEELRLKLNQKYSPDLTEEMIQLAQKNNWMTAPLELAQRTAEKLKQKGKGSQYISTYLAEKGLPVVIIDNAEELQIASKAIEVKFGDIKNLNYDEKPRVLRFLQNRGFSDDVINELNLKEE